MVESDDLLQPSVSLLDLRCRQPSVFPPLSCLPRRPEQDLMPWLVKGPGCLAQPSGMGSHGSNSWLRGGKGFGFISILFISVFNNRVLSALVLVRNREGVYVEINHPRLACRRGSNAFGGRGEASGTPLTCNVTEFRIRGICQGLLQLWLQCHTFQHGVHRLLLGDPDFS